MEQIAVSKFKATCLAVLERVSKTRKPVLVTRFGKPVAQVIPFPEKPKQRIGPLPRKLGLHPGAWVVSDDFDEPLPDEFWFGKQ